MAVLRRHFLPTTPILLSDFGTWQRIKATSTQAINGMRDAFSNVGILNIVLWTCMIIGGIFLTTIPQHMTDAISDLTLYTISAPVLKALQAGLTEGFGGYATGAVLTSVFVAGLASAMLSSADSYLLVALQSFSTDVVGLHTRSDTKSAVRYSRYFALPMALVAYALAVGVTVSGIDPVSYIFILFGSQTVLAPIVVFTLQENTEAHNYRTWCVASGLAGFLTSVGFGIWAVFITDQPFWNTNGSFVVPVIATLIPLIVLLVATWKAEGFEGLKRYLKALVGVYATD